MNALAHIPDSEMHHLPEGEVMSANPERRLVLVRSEIAVVPGDPNDGLDPRAEFQSAGDEPLTWDAINSAVTSGAYPKK